MNIKNKLALSLGTLGLLAGAVTTVALQTHAQTAATTTNAASGNSAADPVKQFDPAKGGHVGSNGIKEELLTGDTAEKVKTAALAAVPGGTIQRVENDAEGAVYEAHMTKADGSNVTVKFDSSFNVTGTESGPGGRGPGHGQPPVQTN